MAITSVKTGSNFTNLQKYDSFLGPNPANGNSATWLIQRTTVGSGGSSPITFSSIPSTYTHLQLRIISRLSTTTTGGRITFNSDTATNYSRHYLEGTGSAATSGTNSSVAFIDVVDSTISSDSANIFGVNVIDILDYANTNKYKTIRNLAGVDTNGAGYVDLYSGSWRSTSAISTITITPQAGNFTQYSSFALYGIKG
jgi:hypothetical protein